MLKAKVLEVRDNFHISYISAIVVVTNDLPAFKRWMNKHYIFTTLKSSGKRAAGDGKYDYYVDLLYTKRQQDKIDLIINKWGHYDPTPKSEKVINWLTFHLGSFTTF